MGRAGGLAPGIMKKLKRAKEALHSVIAMFETGDLPAAVARTMIRPKPGHKKPSDSWSLGNKILMFLNGTDDARGFKQWQNVGRSVNKGAKAFYILAPAKRKVTRKVTDEETGEEKEEERAIITGFREVPVFRCEDTEGDPIPKPEYDPLTPPPLQEIARKFGVQEIRYEPGDGNCYGFFSWGNGKRIVLHTYDVKTWFHELGHAIHATFREMKGGQIPEQEIVAEVFAAAMCEFYGIRGYHFHAWQYVQAFSGEEPQAALKSVFRVLSDVEKCLDMAFVEDDGEKDAVA